MELLKILSNIRTIRKNLTLSKKEIIKLQNSKLEKLIEYVLKNSKFYREYYRKNGITLENFREIPFENYPLLNKDILVANFDDILCTDDVNIKDLEKFISDENNWYKKYKGEYIVITSSGSTGTPTIFIYDEDSWATVRALGICRTGKYQTGDFFKKHRLAFIGAINGPFAAVSLLKCLNMKNYSILTLDVNNSIDENIKLLNEFQPDILSGYSSSLETLAEKSIEGKLRISPKKIVCSADTLSEKRRKIIRNTFKCNPINFYAASESLGIASQIPGKNELFLFEDFYKIELINSKKKEAASGEVGKLVLTNLFNYTLPLIRYEMEDQMRKSLRQDYNFTLIDELIGRTVENLIFKKSDGSEVEFHGLQLVGIFFKGVEKIQFIQNDPKTLLIRYKGEAGKEIENNITKQIKTLLEKYELKDDVMLKLEKVDEIPCNPATEKYESIIPYKSHKI